MPDVSEPLVAPNSRRQVILCDAAGRPTGSVDLLAAHTGSGQLHLAFSVYVFSPDRRRLLIQQRSAEKMLWPLVWANTCCSHPRADESPVEAGRRRLREEMGLDCELISGPTFTYRAEDPAGRGVEHEYDMLLVGTCTEEPRPDPAEVADWAWLHVDDLRRDMLNRPERYAPWFHIGLPKVLLTENLAARGD
jgi:isopentenyl-diphosphate Delta-isomerase